MQCKCVMPHPLSATWKIWSERTSFSSNLQKHFRAISSNSPHKSIVILMLLFFTVLSKHFKAFHITSLFPNRFRNVNLGTWMKTKLKRKWTDFWKWIVWNNAERNRDRGRYTAFQSKPDFTSSFSSFQFSVILAAYLNNYAHQIDLVFLFSPLINVHYFHFVFEITVDDFENFRETANFNDLTLVRRVVYCWLW